MKPQSKISPNLESDQGELKKLEPKVKENTEMESQRKN